MVGILKVAVNGICQGANDIFGLAEHAVGLGLAENRLGESLAQWMGVDIFMDFRIFLELLAVTFMYGTQAVQILQSGCF